MGQRKTNQEIQLQRWRSTAGQTPAHTWSRMGSHANQPRLIFRAETEILSRSACIITIASAVVRGAITDACWGAGSCLRHGSCYPTAAYSNLGRAHGKIRLWQDHQPMSSGPHRRKYVLHGTSSGTLCTILKHMYLGHNWQVKRK